MDCNKIVELLSEYIDGMLDDEQNTEIEKHIAACSRCREDYEMLKSIVDSCHQIDEIDLPGDFHQKLHNRLINESISINKMYKSKKIRKSFTAIAAALILVVSISSAVNSGILNLGSNKESSAVKENAGLKYDSAGSESTDMSAPSEPQVEFNVQTAQKTEMKAAAMPGKGVQGFDAGARVKMIYSVIDINLSQDEYKKYNENIKAAVESFGGYSMHEGTSSYVIPESSLDVFIRKLRDVYNINDILVKSIDVTDEYNRLQNEISDLQEEKLKSSETGDVNNATSTTNTADDLVRQMDRKRSQLDEVSSKSGNVFIQINIK